MTKVEKENPAWKQAGEKIRESRKRAGLNQDQMAKAMNLDKSYLSQLENGHRWVDSFYVNRAAEIEKSNIVNAQQAKDAPAHYGHDSIQERCHQHLRKVLEQYGHDEVRLSWVLVELQRHFPLTAQTTETLAKIGAAKALAEFENLGSAASGTSHTKPLTTEKTGAPGTRTHRRQADRRTPPKPVPKQ